MPIDWEAIDTVLLDMDGTLLDLHFDNFFWLEHLPRRYAEIHARDVDEARGELVERFHARQGSLDWYCVDHWTHELGVDVMALKREVQHLIAVRPFVEDFLAGLQASRKRVLLVTNAHRNSLELKLARVGLERCFDALVTSHDLGRAKEQPGFWAMLQARHPFDPDRTLLVDDNHAVLRSADEFGIRHLLTMAQPDSQAEVRHGLHYPAILHFDEIMPAPGRRAHG